MSRSLRRGFVFALVVPLALGITACAPEYDHTDITAVRASVLGGRVDRARIEVPAGMIVKAHFVSYNDDKKVMPMSLRAKDPAILEIASIVSDYDFAFIGLKPGATEVELLADSKVVLIIAAVVAEQPAPP